MTPEKQFGRWTAVEPPTRIGRRVYQKCRCSCPLKTERLIRLDQLKDGSSRSCGNCPNDVEHLDDGTTAIILETKTGVYRCIIDTADYPLIQKSRWFFVRKEDGGTYVQANKPRKQYIHQALLPGVRSVDHKDHNGLNNRRLNLRPATQKDQNGNLRKGKNKSSLYKGVSWLKQKSKFEAYISLNNKKKHLGLFDSEVEAALAYDAAARKHFGKFAALNIPGPGEQSASAGLESIDDSHLETNLVLNQR